jgi:hypothetical protein
MTLEGYNFIISLIISCLIIIALKGGNSDKFF